MAQVATRSPGLVARDRIMTQQYAYGLFFARWRRRYTKRVHSLRDDIPYSIAIQGVLSILVFESVDLKLLEIHNALILAMLGDILSVNNNK